MDKDISAYMRGLVLKRNKKYGKKWLSDNAKKAAAARHKKV